MVRFESASFCSNHISYSGENPLCRHASAYASHSLAVIESHGSSYYSETSHSVGIVMLHRMYPMFYRHFFHNGSIVIVFSAVKTVSGKRDFSDVQ